MRSTGAASKAAREDYRARKVADGHAREIAESAVGAVYKVPGPTGATCYVVSLSRGTCECKNFEHQVAPCEHLLVAEIVNAKSATCSDCNRRFLGRDLYEVTEDHESLTWFVGDLLCRSCAIGHGII